LGYCGSLIGDLLPVLVVYIGIEIALEIYSRITNKPAKK
jgi:hypothetical protein